MMNERKERDKQRQMIERERDQSFNSRLCNSVIRQQQKQLEREILPRVTP